MGAAYEGHLEVVQYLLSNYKNEIDINATVNTSVGYKYICLLVVYIYVCLYTNIYVLIYLHI